MQGISVFDNLLKFFDEFESRVPYRIGLKDRGLAYSWHILETFIRRLPLKQAYSSFLLKDLRSPKPLLFGKRVTSSGEVWVNIYLKAKKIQEEGKSFEDAYFRAAVEEIQLVLFGRREAERFKLEYNKEDPADRKVLARILEFSKPSKPVKSESKALLSLVEAMKIIDELELAEVRARFLEEEKARLRRSEPGNPADPLKLEELARKAAEKRLKEFVRRREAEKEGRLRDIIWRFEDQLLKHLPAERPLHGWVHWKVDLRSNCFHAIIPIRDGDGMRVRESTKCYALTIHWSDRESVNSKSRLEDHFHAAIRSFNRFLEKRFIREFKREDLRRERVVDHTVILVGNYSRKYQRRNRKGRLLPEMYTGSKLLALLSDAVGLCVEGSGSASKNRNSSTANGTGSRNGNSGNLESLERLGRFVVVDDADLSDAFTGIMLYFRSRLERLKSELSKSGLCYGAVKLMHDRLLVCVDFFKTLSHCSWDSLRPVASLYSGHARKVKRFRRKLESYVRAVAVT